MIPIYLCDDDPVMLQAVCRELENAILIDNHDMAVAGTYTDPEVLLAAVEGDGNRGIYFLDVELKSEAYNGFTLAQALRRLDPRGFLVFVTTHGELALETFRHRLEAMDYIEKDKPQALPCRVQACLREARERLLLERREAARVYSIQVFDETRHIPVEEILYIETSPRQHKLILHADSVIVEYPGKLAEAQQALGEGFWRVHRSYLVSRDRIRRISPKQSLVELDNGEICPLSRKAKAQL